MSEIDPKERYITADQVAERTTMSHVWLERARHEGIGPRWSKIGRRVVYKLSDVLAWIDSGAAAREKLSGPKKKKAAA